MRLLTQATFMYLLITLLIFGVGGILTYNIFEAQVQQETDYYLWQEVAHLAEAVSKKAPLEALTHEHQSIRPWLGAIPTKTVRAYSDTLVWHRYSKSMEPYRKLTTLREVEGVWYQFVLVNSIVESQDIYDSVFSSLSRIFALLVLVVGFCTFFISRALLRPFRKTLQEIQTFRIQTSEELDLPKTPTREFSELNEFISQMTKKVHQDYLSLKEFTENASHEMQTPIAIAKGKLELLLESQDMSEDQSMLIQSAYLSLSKLSKLGRSLTLLTRIENKEFSNHRLLNLSNILDETLFGFQELVELRSLDLSCEMEPGVSIHTDPILVDMLLNNLLQNAIRHNEEGGKITIQLSDHELSIRNTGKPPHIPPTQLFERFRKNPTSGESVGLGLAIVKKICDVNAWQVNYEYEQPWHHIRVVW